MSLTNMNEYKQALYAKFRSVDIAHSGDRRLTADEIEMFRQLLYLTIRGVNGDYKPDEQDQQMIAEYMQYALIHKNIPVNIPPEFYINGKLYTDIDGKPSNMPLYSIFQYILRYKDRESYCFMLPWFMTYKTKDVQWCKQDMIHLERVFYCLSSRFLLPGMERIDISMDAAHLIDVLVPTITYIFKDTQTDSHTLMNKAMTMMKEISLIWSCMMFVRNPLACVPCDSHPDKPDEEPTNARYVKGIIENKLMEYRTLAKNASLRYMLDL